MTGRWLVGALLLAGAGLTVLSYLPALDAGFIFDDDPNIVQDTSVHWTELSLENLGELARNAPNRRRLVANTTFALNYLAGGLEPRGYHRVNLWIHLAVGASLAWLAWLYLIGRGRPESRRIAPLAATVASVLFLLHPLNSPGCDDPEHAYAHYNIAWILDHTGRPQEALPYLRRFLALAPEKLAAFRAPAERRLREISGAPATPDD